MTGYIEPDEVFDQEDYTIEVYRPREYHFTAWLRDVDETLRDLTGYSVHEFAVVPTFGGWSDWPADPFEAARAVLGQDLWGQAFLDDLDRQPPDDRMLVE